MNPDEGDDEKEENGSVRKGKVAFEMTFQGMNRFIMVVE